MEYKSGKCCRWNSQRSQIVIMILGQLLFAVPLMATAADDNEKNLRLHGALVAEPCVIPPGEEEIQLDFGTIIDKQLYSHTRTPGQSFDIHLTECDLTLGQSVNVKFTGTTSQTLPGLLAIDAGSEAKGIAIGLETSDAKPVLFNKASDNFTLQEGNNHIKLRAYVQGEPEAIDKKTIEKGRFSATATFSLEYE